MKKPCYEKLADGQWWGYCGESDMGQTEPVLCTECGGVFILNSTPNQEKLVRQLMLDLTKKTISG